MEREHSSMNLVRQPKGSNLCGQACVATICKVTLDEAIMVMRTKGCTNGKQIIQALRQLGVTSSDKMIRGKPIGSAIVKFTHPDGKSHWVLVYNSKYYDPFYGVNRKVPRYLKNSRITSHIRLY